VGGPKALLINRQNSLQEELGLTVAPPDLVKHGEVMEGCGHVRMVCPKLLLANGEGALVGEFSLVVAALALVKAG
jgi:hypothetical protein